MLNDQEFEDLFRSRLGHWEEPPPPGAWRAIRAARRKPFYRRPLAVAAVLLCLGLLILPAGRRVYEGRTRGSIAAGTDKPPMVPPVRNNSLASAAEKGTGAANGTGAAKGAGRAGTSPDRTQTRPGRRNPASTPDREATFAEGMGPALHNIPEQPGGRRPGEGGQEQPGRNALARRSEERDPVRSSGSNGATKNGRTPSGKARQRVPDDVAASRTPVDEAGSREAVAEPASKATRAGLGGPSGALALALPAEGLVAVGPQPLPVSRQPLKLPATGRKKVPIQPKAQKPTLGGYSVGVFAAPRYSFNRYAPNRQDEWLVSNIRAGDGLRKRLGWEAGIAVRKTVTRHWSWNAGLSYLNLGETLQFEATAARADSLAAQVLPGQGIAVTPVRRAVSRTYDSRYHYAGLRAGASYHLLTTPFQDLYVTGGAGVNLLVRGVTTVSGEDGVAGTYHFPSPRNPLEQLNYALHAGVGFARRIGPRVSLTCEPTVSYFMGSTFKRREPVGLRPYSLGLAVGLRFGEKPFRAP
ncbi:MAG: hypothetical protein AVDCRST_MAG56-6497 [uncultured Cytophagales bacterium]|uniref:Outer membrane protein beta-barrel domain-containing protein n=1 Tax=uncultured Cytophagales bacterium TaxID=158755 RepID=A0A6J4KID8_9SPHI|nr:MAG: hypothetical protein AVDCRST_MAG56-6497 [uncultured Cytophagales bacterium]